MFTFLENLLGFTPFAMIKMGLLILILLYIAFGFIVLRQTNTMSKVVEADVSATIQLISLIHFLAIVGLFLFVLFIL